MNMWVSLYDVTPWTSRVWILLYRVMSLRVARLVGVGAHAHGHYIYNLLFIRGIIMCN